MFWLYVYVNTHIILYIVFWLNTTGMTHLKVITFVMSVPLSEDISAGPIWRISVKFYIGDFYEKSVHKHQIWLKSDTKYRSLQVKTSESFAFADEIKSP